ncbi:MAG: Gfo/Idh/MocA family oxidoreductase [Thermoguttaceae bacterium]|nr:Gfo/Idh/MocA family oxidoreductase [Thermoguttaceae bacterium]
MTRINRRQFIGAGLAATAASFFPAPAQIVRGANERIRLGSISCGGRANELLPGFKSFPEVDIVALCDPDSARVGATQEKYPEVKKTFVDCRKLLDDKEIDAVIVATCDHWHCLAAAWAMQAEKDVYVEKPLAHNIYEGIQVVNAARKYGRVCQVGMQQRSDLMQAEIKKFLHEEKQIGKIINARVNHYMPRNPIGKTEKPLALPETLDKNMWLGPAEDFELYRNTLHYDWHWMWNTGTGEMGNWGVHVLDDCRNNVLLDCVEFPKRLIAGGVRAAYNDDGETPNIHFVYFDSGSIPVVLGVSTLAMKDSKSAGDHPGPGSGYVAYCEGGRLEGQRGRAKAFDADGKLIKEFKGNSGQREHQRNFIDAVLARDPSMLHAEVAIGKATSEWCNMANIAFRCGKPMSAERAAEVAKVADGAESIWGDVLSSAQKTLQTHDISMIDSDVMVSDVMEFDAEKREFVGEGSELANSFIKRKYRNDEFTMPEIDI